MSTKESTAIRDRIKFVCNKKTVLISVTNGCIHLIPEQQHTHVKVISLLNVIATSFKADEWKVDTQNRPIFTLNCFQYRTSNCFSFVINYWEKKKNHRRKLSTIKLQAQEESDCLYWHELIELKLKDALKQDGYVRPRKLLMLVNPFSGKKKGKDICNNKVLPLFRLAGIETTVVFTEYPGHAQEFIESNDISSCDGVVALGGDGTLCEVVNGVLIREQKLRNTPFSLKGSFVGKPISLGKPEMRIGMIPGGTGNTHNFVTQGIADVETALLHIICGESHPLDISSMYDYQGKFIRFSVASLWCGYPCRIMELAKNYKQFGSRAYDIGIILTFKEHKTYLCEVSFLLSSPENPVDFKVDNSRCRYPCPICLEEPSKPSNDGFSSSSNHPEKTPLLQTTECNSSSTPRDKDDESSNFKDIVCSKEDHTTTPLKENRRSAATSQESLQEEKNNWKVVRGYFHMVNAYSNSNIYSESPEGLSPPTHLADGTADLLIVRSTSRMQLMRFFLALRGNANQYDFSFVEAHRVKAFRFRCLSKEEFASHNDSKTQNKNSSDLRVSSKTSTTENDVLQQDSNEVLWDADGDIIPDRDFASMIVHKGLINVFGKGIENY